MSEKPRDKMQRNATVTPKQEHLIAALLLGSTVMEAAQSCKINPSTAHRWFKDTLFQQEYEAARKRLLNHSLTTLQLKFDKAIQTLDRHLGSPKTIPRDQIKAAEVIVERTIQTAQLVERITELEALLVVNQQDEQYIVKFDLRKSTKPERDTLRRINADIATRESETI